MTKKFSRLILIACMACFQGCSCEANFQAGGAQAPTNATGDGGATVPSAAPAPAPAPAPMPVSKSTSVVRTASM